MFDHNEIYKLNNVLTEKEYEGLMYYDSNYIWNFGAQSISDNDRKFWIKDLWESDLGKCEPIEYTFRTIIENSLGVSLETQRLYFNGQSHGQCGNMHPDTWGDDGNDYITMVYYANKEWKPEWGGFTVIQKDSDMHVIYPLPNSAVIFNSRLMHIGLEPTIHCTGMRITLAQKFKILKG